METDSLINLLFALVGFLLGAYLVLLCEYSSLYLKISALEHKTRYLSPMDREGKNRYE